MGGTLTKLRSASVTDLIGLCLVALVVFWLVVNFVKAPSDFIDIALIGLTNGMIFGLVALGYTLVYGILQLINFAHGDVFALSGLVAWSVIVNVIGLDEASSVLVVIGGLLITLVVIMGGFAIFNASIERVAYRPLRNAPRLAPLITAVGMSFIVQNIALAIYGVNYRRVPNFIPQSDVIDIGGVTYSWNKASVLFIVIPLLVLLSWFVRTTKQGKAMRAVAQDTEASAMMGIDVNRTISVTFLLAGSLAGAAGLLYALYFTQVRFDQGFQLGLIAFTAAVLGGIGMTGAVLGALMIGFIQAFNEGLGWLAPGSDWTRSMVFGILILILVFRPEGILGEQTPEGA
jgi:branched-chain amino acid transport system permease protein